MRRVLLPGAAAALLVAAIGWSPANSDRGAAAAADAERLQKPAPQRDTIPLTITMPTGEAGNDAVGRVVFPGVNPGRVYERGDVRTQYYVGNLVKQGTRFGFDIEYFNGASDNSDTLSVSFGAEAICRNEPTEDRGIATRIACAAGAPGTAEARPPYRIVCSAIYAYEGDPPDSCEGTFACVKCKSGVRACGQDPQCAD